MRALRRQTRLRNMDAHRLHRTVPTPQTTTTMPQGRQSQTSVVVPHSPTAMPRPLLLDLATRTLTTPPLLVALPSVRHNTTLGGSDLHMPRNTALRLLSLVILHVRASVFLKLPLRHALLHQPSLTALLLLVPTHHKPTGKEDPITGLLIHLCRLNNKHTSHVRRTMSHSHSLRLAVQHLPLLSPKIQTRHQQ